MENRKKYPDDLTEQEWECTGVLVEAKENKTGRKPKHERREILNAIFYLLTTGCSWRHLPHDLPGWKSLYSQFRRWRLCGLFERIHDHIRGELRVLLKRNQEPTAEIADSQSVKTTEKGG